MSAAMEKNTLALKALFGSEGLAGRLSSTRLAVVTPQCDVRTSTRLLASVLCDTLARLWPNIDFHGEVAPAMLLSARAAAQAGGGTGEGLQVKWAPPYDVVIAIGCEPPVGASSVIRLGANDWCASLGENAVCGPSNNPVGPAFAAAIGGAQAFHRVFEKELCGMDATPIEDWHADVRELFDAPLLDTGSIDLGEIHFFGVGAVTHGMMWLIEQWPSQVTGQMNLVDQDKFGSSNGQRYSGMQSHHIGRNKVDVVAERLRTAHAALQVNGHATDLNTYCAARGYERQLLRVVAGLDSAEARRHVALKLPEHSINMWTAGERIGAGRYVPGSGGACLACDYLEKVDVQVDEVGELHQQIGIRPDVIRVLLDTSRGLTANEASQVASRWGISTEQLVGQPLRSVMPMLCATGKVQLPNSPEAVDVPFAFASMFAGIAGFMMMLKDLSVSEATSEGWTQHIFKSPSSLLRRPLPSRTECVCCSTRLEVDWPIESTAS